MALAHAPGLWGPAGSPVQAQKHGNRVLGHRCRRVGGNTRHPDAQSLAGWRVNPVKPSTPHCHKPASSHIGLSCIFPSDGDLHLMQIGKLSLSGGAQPFESSQGLCIRFGTLECIKSASCSANHQHAHHMLSAMRMRTAAHRFLLAVPSLWLWRIVLVQEDGQIACWVCPTSQQLT